MEDQEGAWPGPWRECDRAGGLSRFWLADPLGNPGSFQAESLVGDVERPVVRDVESPIGWGGQGFSCHLTLIPPVVAGMVTEVGGAMPVCVHVHWYLYLCKYTCACV